jgi:hypothetical protein
VTPGADAQLGRTNIDWAKVFGDKTRLEVWNLAGTPRLEKTIEKAPFTHQNQPSGSRFVFPHGAVLSFQVFDVLDGKVVFGAPTPSQTDVTPAQPAVLALSGGRLFGGYPRRLWNINTQDELWRQRDYEQWGSTWNKGRFRVREQWQKMWESLAGWKFETDAYRSTETGICELRVPVRDRSTLTFWNAADTLAVAGNGAVYRLPLPVNWALLALCQAVLAIPIVLLWLALHGRRKRLLRRLASPAERHPQRLDVRASHALLTNGSENSDPTSPRSC